MAQKLLTDMRHASICQEVTPGGGGGGGGGGWGGGGGVRQKERLTVRTMLFTQPPTRSTCVDEFVFRAYSSADAVMY